MTDDHAATAATSHIVVGWDSETETVYVYQAAPGEAEGNPHLFEADVPSALWEELMATRRAYDELEGRVVQLAGVDSTMGRLAVCCRRWQGDVMAGRRWFSLVLGASGYEAQTEWPVGDLSVSMEDTRAAAEARIADMPEEFHLLDGSCRRLLLVRRDSFRVEEGGFGPYVSACHHCGWSRHEHPGGDADAVLSARAGTAVEEAMNA